MPKDELTKEQLRAIALQIHASATQLAQVGTVLAVLQAKIENLTREVERLREAEEQSSIRIFVQALAKGSAAQKFALLLPIVIVAVLSYAAGTGASPELVFSWLTSLGVAK